MKHFPAPVLVEREPFHIDRPGTMGILSDVHIPFHSELTLKLAMEKAKEEKWNQILLNGDFLDMSRNSTYLQSPTLHAIEYELEKGEELIRWIKSKIPRVKIYWREGNHEERFKHILFRNAPMMANVRGFTIKEAMQLDKLNVTYIEGKRIVYAGRLPILHGHEFPRTIASPVNAARGAWLKAKTSVMVGHHHQSHEHTEPILGGKMKKCWAVGCCCVLSPDWNPFNSWNNGFASVRIRKDGSYLVNNYSIVEGKIA